MSLQDQKRVLIAIWELTSEDIEEGISQDAINLHLGRPRDDARLGDRLDRLEEAGYIEGADGNLRIRERDGLLFVRLTPKGLWGVGKGPRPPD